MIPHPICPYAGCNSPEGECLGVCCADSRGHTNMKEEDCMTDKKDTLLESHLNYTSRVIGHKPEPQAQVGDTEVWGVWMDGEPPHPWREEWFIAETIYEEPCVLRALPEEHSYDYKTADETYIKAKNIKRWMQFPNGEYISAATKSIAKKDAALKACVEALTEAKETIEAYATVYADAWRPGYDILEPRSDKAFLSIDVAISQAQEALK